ncbi:MAG: M42 family metallopeptidase [Syntrophobacteraceae bacterium]|jgi:endoglucanase|nr:M42 family metallopeptidase [Syntrophobacteraceae bacterium]
MMNDSSRTKALELLKGLGEAHGAAGSEDSVRRIFREELGGLTIQPDGMGNLFCEKPGLHDRPRIMVAAHMDEVGFVVQSITKTGLIKLSPLGGWWPHTLLAQRVRILTGAGSEILGIIGAKPPHFLQDAERDKLMKLDDMFIDVGAGSREEVLTEMGIRLGDPIVPFSPFTPLSRPDLFVCKALDDRIGVALTIQLTQELASRDHPNTVVAVATVQEEVGVRGAQTAAFTAKPDAAIVLEGTPADDFPGTSEEEQQGVLGRGAQVRLLDPSAIMNRRMVDLTLDLARKHQIPHQVAVRKSGSTDARAIHLHGAGIPTIVLGVPARYIHTHNSILNVQDYASALDLTLRLLMAMDSKTVESFTAF